MQISTCPLCDAYGIVTPSEVGDESVEASIDVGLTEPITGTLCEECRRAGIGTDGQE